MTNADVARQLGISRPTVASLISSAEAKLGATTRTQAIALVAELDAD
jgi:DNA-binding CsgD family transcriptional regulator